MKTFEDLLYHISVLQNKYSEIKESPDYSLEGILKTFRKKFDSEHDEIMILYVDKDEDSDEFVGKSLWINKKTKDIIDEPGWFTERKQIIEKAKEKGFS